MLTYSFDQQAKCMRIQWSSIKRIEPTDVKFLYLKEWLNSLSDAQLLELTQDECSWLKLHSYNILRDRILFRLAQIENKALTGD